MWNRLKAKWRAHDNALASRELRRETVEAEAGDNAVPTIVSPYLDQPVQPSTGLMHPEQGDEAPRTDE
jgi:hypothetical protein